MKRAISCLLCVAALLSLPLCKAWAADSNQQTDVLAQVEEHFVFVYPSDQEITSGRITTELGVTGFQEWLMESDERLRIVILAQEPMHQDGGEAVLPWSVGCRELPDSMGGIGTWQVATTITEDAWRNAAPGKYTGTIRFEVYSLLSGGLMMKGSTRITTTVPAKTIPVIPPITGDALPLWLIGVGLTGLITALYTGIRKHRKI